MVLPFTLNINYNPKKDFKIYLIFVFVNLKDC